MITRRLFLLLLAAAYVPAAIARPECQSDTFTGEQSCVYDRGSVGLPGIGNQIITKDGKMFYRRNVWLIGGDPVNVDRILFRVDGRRTIQLTASNVSDPQVSCTNRLCTWSWTVVAPISADALRELASARKLIIGIQGGDRRVEEAELKRGGNLFARFLADILATEPHVLDTADADVFLLEAGQPVPYSPQN